MNVVITEGKFENLVVKYLDEMFYPDYGWNNSYQEDVDKWGDIVFFIDDVDSYIYYGCNANSGLGPEDKFFGSYGHLHNHKCPLLSIYPRVSERLRDMFGNKWKPIFKKWFESNTGLKVEQITDDYI